MLSQSSPLFGTIIYYYPCALSPIDATCCTRSAAIATARLPDLQHVPFSFPCDFSVWFSIRRLRPLFSARSNQKVNFSQGFGDWGILGYRDFIPHLSEMRVCILLHVAPASGLVWCVAATGAAIDLCIRFGLSFVPRTQSQGCHHSPIVCAIIFRHSSGRPLLGYWTIPFRQGTGDNF